MNGKVTGNSSCDYAPSWRCHVDYVHAMSTPFASRLHRMLVLMLLHVLIVKPFESDKDQRMHVPKSSRLGLNTLVKNVIFIITALALTSRLPSSFGAQDTVFLFQSSDTTAVGQ